MKVLTATIDKNINLNILFFSRAAYAKNGKGSTFDSKKIKAAYKKIKVAKKHPASINLSEETLSELKALATKKGLPYQTLIRMLVLEGIARIKKSA